jgi:2-phospho-L-lactate guanylyltransferase
MTLRLEAIIAVRGGPSAKTRLAGRLDLDRRENLVRAMLADMLSALSLSPKVQRVIVVTPTQSLGELAISAGATVIAEPNVAGLNAAFESGRRIADPTATSILLPGDLPCLDAADIDACTAVSGARHIVLAPASTGHGTGAILIPPGIPFRCAFGRNSLGRHLEIVRSLGLAARLVDAPGLSFDIDDPRDLEALAITRGGQPSVALVRGWMSAKWAAMPNPTHS